MSSVMSNLIYDFMFTHKSVSFVTITHVKLGIVLRLVQALVLVYAIYEIMIEQKYMKPEVPTGEFNSWGESWAYSNSSPEYCDNPDTNYRYNDAWLYNDNKCRDFAYGEVMQKLPSGGLYVQTYVQETRTTKRNCTTDGLVCAEKESSSENYFVPGTEDIALGFDHAYIAQSSGMRGKNVVSEVVAVNGSVVKTFEEGHAIFLSLSQWLNAAGIESLDALNPHSSPPGNSEQPRYRLSGANLRVTVTYSNYHGMSDTTVRATIAVIETGNGWAGTGGSTDYQTFTSGNDTEYIFLDKYSYGIKFSQLATGKVGKPDLATTIASLVSFTVMLGVASAIADLVASYFLGDISKAFQAKKKEKINLDAYQLTNTSSASAGVVGGSSVKPFSESKAQI